MTRRIQTKFLVPILILQFVALATLGYIGYRFASDTLRKSAEQSFSKTINGTYNSIEDTLKLRTSQIEKLLSDPLFIKFFAAPQYKSDVDIAVYNFQKGNGLAVGEPEIGGLVNYPIGLLPNEGNRKVTDRGTFPSEEYVGLDGIVKQHVYLGGSNDVDFSNWDEKKLDRSQTQWFQTAKSGKVYIGRPEKFPLFLRKYDPVGISSTEETIEETLVPIAIPHRVGDKIVGVLMVTTIPDFIETALPKRSLKSNLRITDGRGNLIANVGDDAIESELQSKGIAEMTGVEEKISDVGDYLSMHRRSELSGWTFSVFGRKADIYGAVWRLRNNIFIVIITSIAVMGLIVFLIIRELLKPILRLTRASDRIAAGELGVVVSDRGNDEIRRLTDSFNKMSTTTKEMHEELEKQNIRLARINFIRKQLLTIISHELRTPLNHIVGFFDLMSDEISEAKDEKYKEIGESVDGLGRSIERYKKLVERLTKASSVISSEMTPMQGEAENCVLSSAVESAVAEAKRQTKHPIDVHIADNLREIEVRAEGDSIRLMLDEAISNAVKYSPENEPIVVSVSADDKDASVSVENKGPGIPKEYIDEVTQPFFEVQDTVLHFTDRYKKGGGGLGLGLTIIGSVLRRFGGSLKIESDEGKGTNVIMVLPKV